MKQILALIALVCVSACAGNSPEPIYSTPSYYNPGSGAAMIPLDD